MKRNLIQVDSTDLTQTRGSLAYEIVKHPLRIRVFLLLYFYNELNVSQICKLLHESKTTVARHLDNMEKKEILQSRTEEVGGQFNPRIYSINEPVLRQFIPMEQVIPQDPDARLKLYTNSLGFIQAITVLIQFAIGLMHPLINAIGAKSADLDALEESVGPYFFPLQKLDFQTVVLGEKSVPQFIKLFHEFHEKVTKLADQEVERGDEKSLIFLGTLLPLRDMLEFDETSHEKKIPREEN